MVDVDGKFLKQINVVVEHTNDGIVGVNFLPAGTLLDAVFTIHCHRWKVMRTLK